MVPVNVNPVVIRNVVKFLLLDVTCILINTEILCSLWLKKILENWRVWLDIKKSDN